VWLCRETGFQQQCSKNAVKAMAERETHQTTKDSTMAISERMKRKKGFISMCKKENSCNFFLISFLGIIVQFFSFLYF
jgi:hypothetical protein